MENIEKTEIKSQKEHWDNSYIKSSRNINPNWKPIYYDFRSIASVIEPIIQKDNVKSIMEIGCGDSIWLPYFLKTFNCEGGGIDYSEIGCNELKERLGVCGVCADVFCKDIFEIERENGLHMENQKIEYDLVYSLGVIEHFENTQRIIEIFAKIVKEKGYIVSIIPNFSSFSFHKLFCYCYQPEILKIHNLLSLPDLIKAHNIGGFRVVSSGYLGKFSMGIPAWGVTPRKIFGANTQKHREIGNAITKYVWKKMQNINSYSGGSIFAPYIYCVIQREY